MKTIETKNKLIINDLVKKHFSLTKKSQKLFTQRLLYERPIAKEYAQVLNGAEDLRARFDIGEDFLEGADQSWENFRYNFKDYVNSKKIKYSNYYNNKVIVNKNEKKIFKDMLDFYNQKLNDWLYNEEGFPEDIKKIHYGFFYSFERKIKDIVYIKVKKLYSQNSISAYDLNFSLDKINEDLDIIPSLFSRKCFENITITIRKYSSPFYGIMTLEQLFPSEKDKDNFLKEMKSFSISSFENVVSNAYNNIVQKKPFGGSEKLELVISLNYADWFLCSTGDSWSSCISLYSTYDECYWVGVPNLLGDKSRAMVYITKKNGPKKDFYGIKTDKFLVRTWVQLFRTVPHKDGNKNFKGYNKTFFNMVRPYPMELSGLEQKIESLIGIPSFETINKNYFLEYRPDAPYYKSCSRYYAENFWFERDGRGIKTMTTIYLDKGSYKLANKNKTKYFYGDYGYYKFDGEGGSSFAFQTGHQNNISSLSQLIASGISFAEIVDDNSTLLKEINRWIEGYNRNYDEDDYDEDDYDEDDYDEDSM